MILLRLALIGIGVVGLLATLFMNATNDRVFRDWKLAGLFGGIALMGLM